jgi:hypothetical protein
MNVQMIVLMSTNCVFAYPLPVSGQKKPYRIFSSSYPCLSFEEFWELLDRPPTHGKPLGVLSYERMLTD